MNRRTRNRICSAVVVEPLELRRLLAADFGYDLERAVIKPSGSTLARGNDAFGMSVATRPQDTYALVGAPNTVVDGFDAGAAYVIDTSDGSLVREIENPTPLDADQFGAAVLFIGTKLVIGAPGASAIYIYDDIDDLTPNEIITTEQGFGGVLASDGADLFTASLFSDEGSVIRRYEVVDSGTDGLSVLNTYQTGIGIDGLGAQIAVQGNHVYGLTFGGDVWQFDKATEAATHFTTDAVSVAVADDTGHVFVGKFIDLDEYDDIDAVEKVDQYASSGSFIRNYTTPATPVPNPGVEFFGGWIDTNNRGEVIISAAERYDDGSLLPNGAVYVFDYSTGTHKGSIFNPTVETISATEDEGEAFGANFAMLPGGKLLIANPLDKNTHGSDAGAVYVYSPTSAGPTIEEVDGSLIVTGTDDPETITIVKLEVGVTTVTVGDVTFNYTGPRIVVHAGGRDDLTNADERDDVIAVGASVTANVEIYGGPGNDYISGGAGNDILVGGPGNDVIYGHTGRDLLIGGLEKDTLYGEVGDDILIAGSTGDDDDSVALNGVLAIWTNPELIYQQRVDKLRDEWLGTTVYNDDAPDMLYGRNGDDWFIFADDDSADLKKDEVGPGEELLFLP